MEKEIVLAKSSGFCFGVKKAVDTVYEKLEEGGRIYTFGEIIHNEYVTGDLAQKGVEIIKDIEDISGREKGTVIIRSHGVEKAVYDALEDAGMEIIDATCPYVLKIHRIVEKASSEGKHVIIIGDKNHPEVQGIMGWCTSPASVIDNEDDAKEFVSPRPKIHIVSQTTFQKNKFAHLVEIISRKKYNANISNTICNATEVRQKEACVLAKNVDAMVVIGGKNSSNTRKLYEISKQECENTILISGINDLDFSQLKEAKRIGITAGASTPNNIIQEVYTSGRRQVW